MISSCTSVVLILRKETGILLNLIYVTLSGNRTLLFGGDIVLVQKMIY